jgi:hypothetical protein
VTIIKVNTAERQFTSSEGFSWEVQEDGMLWIRDEDDGGIATFAPGTWSSIYFAEDDDE